MRKLTIVVAALGLAGGAAALDLGGLKDAGKVAGKDAAKDAVKQADTAADQKYDQARKDALNKKLQDVQNEKGPILFKKGGAVIDPKCDKTMQTIADILKEFPDFKVEVNGHTDNVGKPAKNQKLSQQRAQAVINYLASKKKVDKKRLTAKGYGDTKPIADNSTPEGRDKNRRVDFTVF
jgi:outer membrane protein OmpA-like peptidoglycan-associated protein